MAKAPCSIEDITPRFDDLNPWDRVYRSASGYTVKVKAVEVRTGDPSRLCFRVSGSLCDDKTGKARVFGAGHFICPAREVAIQSTSKVDIAELIEQARAQAVRDVEAAELNRVSAASLSGVRRV